jgi:two-component system chemotaxis response regulator CheY
MAIQKINEGDNSLTVDAAICDIRMPQIDGTEAINYLQKEYPTLPLIVMTGFADTQLAVGFLKNGVKDYLIKPVGKDTLLAAVNKAVLERQRH